MDPQTKRLAAELESLGGGDAKAAHLELHAIIDDSTISDKKSTPDVPNKRSQLSQILWPLGKSVGLRDIKLPGTTAIADSMRYFTVSSTTRVSSVDHSKCTTYHPHSVSIAKWLQDGFNATVINYGPKCAIKTTALFGPQVPLSTLQQPHVSPTTAPPTLVSEVLRQLFKSGVEDEHKSSVPLPSPPTVAVSMWYLCNNTVVDVCCSSSHSSAPVNSFDDKKLDKEWLQFSSVTCPDFETAMRVIQTARSRCPTQDEHHVFLRVLFYRPHRGNHSDTGSGSLSHLHLVDLVNAAGVDDSEHRMLPTEEGRIVRRDHWLQLNSLWQVLREMTEMSRQSDRAEMGAAGDRVLVTSARSSKLTVLLAPLLQGNTKTWFFVHLRDGENNFQQSSHTLKHVDGITDIVTGCYRIQNIDKDSLDLKDADTVLLPVFSSPEVHQQTRAPQDEGEVHKTSAGRGSSREHGQEALARNRVDNNCIIEQQQQQQLNSGERACNSLVHCEEVENVNLHSLAAEYDSFNPHLDRHTTGVESHFHPEALQHQHLAHDHIGNSSAHCHLEDLRFKVLSGNQGVREQESPPQASPLLSGHTEEVAGVSENRGKNEYLELMGEFHALMNEVSSSEPPPVPLPLHDSTTKQADLSPHLDHELIDSRSYNRTHSSVENNVPRQTVERDVDSITSSSTQPHEQSDSLFPSEVHQHRGKGRQRRHQAHGSTSSGSYTRNSDDFLLTDDEEGEGIENMAGDLWDSLDDDGGSGGSFTDQSSRRSDRERHSQPNHGNSDDGSDSSGNQHSSKLVPVTSSFYNWAANTPKQLPQASKHSSPRSRNEHRNQRQQASPLPASQERNIDTTHKEVLANIEQHTGLGEQRSTRFPYYDTVQAIEAASPHAYENHRGDNSTKDIAVSPSCSHPPRRHQNMSSSGRGYVNIDAEYDEENDGDENGEFLDDSIDLQHIDDHLGNGYGYGEGGVDLNEENKRLERVNASLLLALQQEKHERAQMEDRLSALQDNAVEAQTQNELVEESHKIEVLRLKSHMRRLAQESGFEETLQGFEEDMSRALKEKSALQRRNCVLEDRLFLLGNGAGTEEGGDGEDGDEREHSSFISNAGHASASRGGSASGTFTSSVSNSHAHSLSVVWTAAGMASAGGEEVVSAKEFRILKHKYKRSQKACEELTSCFEELRRKERKFMLGAKHSEETLKKMRVLCIEKETLSDKLKEVVAQLDQRTREVELLKYEARALQDAERSVRSERSNIVHELAVARHRIRENDAELKEQRYRNRFISKHGYANGGSAGRGQNQQPNTVHRTAQPKEDPNQVQQNNQTYFDLLSTSAYSDGSPYEDHHFIPLPNLDQGKRASDLAVTGVAGSAEAMYLRSEEVETLSIALEQALLDLRDAITLNCPSLLPLVHSLSNELRKERALAHEQKVALVTKSSRQGRTARSSTSTGVPGPQNPLHHDRLQQPPQPFLNKSPSRGRNSVSFADERSKGGGGVVPSRIAGNSSLTASRLHGSRDTSVHGESSQQQGIFSAVQHRQDLPVCSCAMSQKPHHHHQQNCESVVIDIDNDATQSNAKRPVGSKPKMAFFRRVE